jgi:hypothetical protein
MKPEYVKLGTVPETSACPSPGIISGTTANFVYAQEEAIIG